MKTNWLRFTLLTALFSVVPALILGAGAMQTTSFYLYWVLTLIVPFILLRQNSLKSLLYMPFERWQYFYCWFLWNFFLYMGSASIRFSIPSERTIVIAIIWCVVCTLEIACITGSAWLLSRIYTKRDPRRYLRTVWNMAILSLPLPMIMLGNLLFLDLRNPMIQMYINPRVLLFSVQLVVYVLVLVTMAVTVFYLYPRDGEKKGPRFVSILVTAIVWLAINGHMLFGYIPPIFRPLLAMIFPSFTGNFLVYITPGIFEYIVLLISYGFAYIIEQYWLTKQQKNIKNK